MGMKDSPWSMEKSKEGAELRLEYREQAIDLMQELMRHKMFHRAKKIPVADRKKKKDDTDREASLPPSPQALGRKGKGDREKEKGDKDKGGLCKEGMGYGDRTGTFCGLVGSGGSYL